MKAIFKRVSNQIFLFFLLYPTSLMAQQTSSSSSETSQMASSTRPPYGALIASVGLRGSMEQVRGSYATENVPAGGIGGAVSFFGSSGFTSGHSTIVASAEGGSGGFQGAAQLESNYGFILKIGSNKIVHGPLIRGGLQFFWFGNNLSKMSFLDLPTLQTGYSFFYRYRRGGGRRAGRCNIDGSFVCGRRF